ncbi:MAG: hypothetical protein O2967_11750 [Proteobacteria bacterium]|nr:hypothetical protein [Pseudomonadota bacterium]
MLAGKQQAAEKTPPPPAPEKLYPSKLKLGILILPCLLGVAMALQSDEAAEFVLAEMRWTNLLAILIPLFVAGLLLQMAFDRKPVVVFDEVGVHCRRPPIGLIPWSAVIGMGAANATLMRRVLMVAVDPGRLDEKARTFVRNSIGFLPLISPQMSKFQKAAKGYPSVHIPISHLSRSTREIERLAQEFVLYYVAEDE